jgi:CubicO group peptidase (beta-lactamase class C family)
MSRFNRLRAGAVAVLTFLLIPALAAANSALATYAEKGRREFNVPGLAVAVVKDGKVVFEQGMTAP